MGFLVRSSAFALRFLERKAFLFPCVVMLFFFTPEGARCFDFIFQRVFPLIHFSGERFAFLALSFGVS